MREALKIGFGENARSAHSKGSIRSKFLPVAMMMHRFCECVLVSASLFFLMGCAALAGLFSSGGGSASSNSNAVTPVASAATASVPSFMDELEPSTRLVVFSPAALLNQNMSLERTIQVSQCRFGTADPPFLVPNMNVDKNWTFNGRIEEVHSKGDEPASSAEALEYRSWFGLGSPKQQLNTWPVALVSLSQMPEQYLQDRITMLSDHQQQIDKTQVGELTRHYIENSRNIQARVELLVSSFDPNRCPSK